MTQQLKKFSALNHRCRHLGLIRPTDATRVRSKRQKPFLRDAVQDDAPRQVMTRSLNAAFTFQRSIKSICLFKGFSIKMENESAWVLQEGAAVLRPGLTGNVFSASLLEAGGDRSCQTQDRCLGQAGSESIRQRSSDTSKPLTAYTPAVNIPRKLICC